MILILGKNGSGKNHITSHLEKMGLKRIISYTTRPKRPNEVENIDYVFVDRNEFEKKIANGEFIEYKMFAGNYYGTPKENIETSDLIISGGKISPALIPYIDTVFYIDSPLSMRYEGMKDRKSSDIEIFNRIHGENDEYLFDLKSKIFTNTHQDNIAETIYRAIKDKDLVKNKSFRNFIANCVDIYKEENHKEESQLLHFLNYEEYLLRKMYLEDRLTREEYDKEITKFLVDNKYFFVSQDSHYTINLDGKPTYCKKLVKTNEK